MIAELRTQLVADLRAVKVPVYDAWPPDPDVPCLIVVPATRDIYVGAGQTFGSYEVSIDVLILTSRDRAAGLRSLDGLIEAVLANTIDWALSGVETPNLVSVGPGQVLGTVVQLSKSGRLG